MISIDLQPNLAPRSAAAVPLVTARRLTRYLGNQTPHNWLFVALNKRGGGGASSFVLVVIQQRPTRSHEEGKIKQVRKFEIAPLSLVLALGRVTEEVLCR